MFDSFERGVEYDFNSRNLSQEYLAAIGLDMAAHGCTDWISDRLGHHRFRNAYPSSTSFTRAASWVRLKGLGRKAMSSAPTLSRKASSA